MVWNRRHWCAATSLGLTVSALPAALRAAVDKADRADKAGAFGTALRPFSAQSPWNSRPVEPVLDDWEIPKASYAPALESGKWSTGVFVCAPSDPSTNPLSPPHCSHASPRPPRCRTRAATRSQSCSGRFT